MFVSLQLHSAIGWNTLTRIVMWSVNCTSVKLLKFSLSMLACAVSTDSNRLAGTSRASPRCSPHHHRDCSVLLRKHCEATLTTEVTLLIILHVHLHVLKDCAESQIACYVCVWMGLGGRGGVQTHLWKVESRFLSMFPSS